MRGKWIKVTSAALLQTIMCVCTGVNLPKENLNYNNTAPGSSAIVDKHKYLMRQFVCIFSCMRFDLSGNSMTVIMDSCDFKAKNIYKSCSVKNANKLMTTNFDYDCFYTRTCFQIKVYLNMPSKLGVNEI